MKPTWRAAKVQSLLKCGCARASSQAATFSMAWLTFFRVSSGDRSDARGSGVAGVSPTQACSEAVSWPNKMFGMSRMTTAMPAVWTRCLALEIMGCGKSSGESYTLSRQQLVVFGGVLSTVGVCLAYDERFCRKIKVHRC